jgi:hypothetical protein
MISQDRYFSTITLPNWYWELVTKIVDQTKKQTIENILLKSNQSTALQDFKLLHLTMNQKFGDKNGND